MGRLRFTVSLDRNLLVLFLEFVPPIFQIFACSRSPLIIVPTAVIELHGVRLGRIEIFSGGFRLLRAFILVGLGPANLESIGVLVTRKRFFVPIFNARLRRGGLGFLGLLFPRSSCISFFLLVQLLFLLLLLRSILLASRLLPMRTVVLFIFACRH